MTLHRFCLTFVEMLNQHMVTELYRYYNGLHKKGFDQRSFYICAAQRLMQALGRTEIFLSTRGKSGTETLFRWQSRGYGLF